MPRPSSSAPLPLDPGVPSVAPARRRTLQAFGAWGAAGMLGALGLSACGGGGGGSGGSNTDGGSGGDDTSTDYRVATLNASLDRPWSLAFLPDGKMLVTERGGTLLRLSENGKDIERRWTDLPAVQSSGQGGLLDVAVPPDYEDGGYIYWSYSEPGTGAEAGLAGTAVARARLRGNALGAADVIFRQRPKVRGDQHFGSRLAFGRDGMLFIALGERHQDDPEKPGRRYAQNVANDLGKVVRIQPDGGIPADNPSFDDRDARPELYSIGHRNPQGAAVHPDTGELWVVEHGPQGGDELNRVRPGRNYGWPLRSYGCNYGDPVGKACRIGGGTHAPDYEEPRTYWVPTSIAPSGLMFYTGSKFSAWKGQAFVGALAGTALWRLELNGTRVVKRHRMQHARGARIRDVRQGPDGWIYLLTDEGELLRLQR